MNVFEKKGPKHVLSQIIIYAILIFFTFMALYPVFWLFVSSFKTTQEYHLRHNVTADGYYRGVKVINK